MASYQYVYVMNGLTKTYQGGKTVLNGVTVRGSIVGTRLDLQEALNFAGQGKVKATVATEPLDNINDIFARMHAGDIQGRIGIDFQKEAR